ncbi:hypothetical protein F4804DRAFT_353267, partial [Jackrogersella minutella]
LLDPIISRHQPHGGGLAPRGPAGVRRAVEARARVRRHAEPPRELQAGRSRVDGPVSRAVDDDDDGSRGGASRILGARPAGLVGGARLVVAGPGRLVAGAGVQLGPRVGIALLVAAQQAAVGSAGDRGVDHGPLVITVGAVGHSPLLVVVRGGSVDVGPALLKRLLADAAQRLPAVRAGRGVAPLWPGWRTGRVQDEVAGLAELLVGARHDDKGRVHLVLE